MSDIGIHSITFSALGLSPAAPHGPLDNDTWVWRSGNMNLVACYFGFPPDLCSLEDLEQLRRHMSDAFETERSPSATYEDPVRWTTNARPRHVPDESTVLEVEVRPIASVPSVVVVIASRNGKQRSVQSTTFIPFAECFWTLQIGLFGVDLSRRVAAVEDRILNAVGDRVLDVSSLDPYDRRWDGVTSLDHDPLATLRQLALTLHRSVQLSPQALDLEPFEGSG
jgi:hypothetical protein